MCVRFAVDTKLVRRKKEKKSTSVSRYFWKREKREEEREFYIGRDRIARGGTRERERTREKKRTDREGERIISEHTYLSSFAEQKTKKKREKEKKETFEVNSTKTTLQSGISVMELIRTGFALLSFFFPSVSVLLPPHRSRLLRHSVKTMMLKKDEDEDEEDEGKGEIGITKVTMTVHAFPSPGKCPQRNELGDAFWQWAK